MVLRVPAELAVGADPAVAVPVVVIGTFAVMAALGFTLNNLTLFGLVLAIGIVVDDAIVVVEAVEHHIEHGLAPREATHQGDGRGGRRRSIAIAPGAVGGVRPVRVHHRHHRPVLPPVRPDHRRLDGDLGVQLADPSPALSALLLKPHDAQPDRGSSSRDFGGWLARGFNRGFDAIAARLCPASCTRSSARMIALFGMLLALSSGFVRLNGLDRAAGADRLHPAAGQGLPARQRPAARRRLADAHRRRDAPDRARSARRRPGVAEHGRHRRPVAADFTNASNFGVDVRRCSKPFEERAEPGLTADAIAGDSCTPRMQAIQEAFIVVDPAAAGRGLGTAGGFKIRSRTAATSACAALPGRHRRA